MMLVSIFKITFIEFFFLFYFLKICLLFRATTMAHGSSQARVRIRAVDAGLRQSSQQHRILNPLSEARDGTCVLMDTHQIHFP